jgi:hypothetical protein
MSKIDVNTELSVQNIEHYLKRQRYLDAREKRIEENIKEEDDKESVKDFDKNLQKGWNEILNETNQGTNVVSNEIIENEINTNLIENFTTKYVTADELELLIEYFDDNNNLLKDMDTLCNDISNSSENSETNILNNFIVSRSLNQGQIYMIISYVMEKLRQNQEKLTFLRKLQKWIKKYEYENSGYLFDFFNIIGNKDLNNKNIKSVDVLAKFSSENISTSGLKKTIEQISIISDNKFDGIVSLYMKLKVEELKSISKHEILNLEAKAKLNELITVEKTLIIINSIINNQKLFVKDLINENFVDKSLWENINLKDLLLGIVNFCEANFIVKMTIDKYLSNLNIVNIDNLKYTKIIYLLMNIIKKLPKDLFSYKSEKVKDLIDKLNIIRGDLQNIKESNNEINSNSSTPVFINNKKRTITKFI